MKTQTFKLTILLGLAPLLLLFTFGVPAAHAQNTAVNYLGNLTGISGPVTGTYDFKFRLFEKESGTPQLGNTVFKTGVPVQNGSFAVSLDFGIVLLPITYFIEVSVKPAGPGDYVLLLPLQKFSPFATAQTADVANLATYANTSGSATTSGYATNAGSANYANSSGTSGFTTNAGYANTSGTATFATNSATSGYATNAGTANFATNSGYATNAGTADFATTSGTSGYATNAGTANFANSSGTSGYATNAGTANYANASGTSGFATNAGFANTAGVAMLASNVAPNSIGTVALQDNSVTGAKIPSGTVVRSLNTLTDHVLLEPGPNIFITSSNQTITVSASAAVGGSGWGFSGNTVAGEDFLGTLNAQALEFRVNGLRALRLSPNDESPSLLGGSFANEITNEAVGVVIAGGGNTNGPQLALGSYAVIGGGWSNRAAGLAVVGGGFGNQATGSNSVVAGGLHNRAMGLGAVVSGGGRFDYIVYPIDYVDEPNVATGDYSVIAGGSGNVASGAYAVVSGGQRNQASGTNSVVGGGVLNQALGTGSVVGGGGKSQTDFPFSPAEPNVIEGDYSVISGGRSNYIAANVLDAVIGGGHRNQLEGEAGVIGGGRENHALGYISVIAGGFDNQAVGNHAVVSGGMNNRAFGDGAVVPGGMDNTASGIGSLAAGIGATASHANTFVWSDGQSGPVASSGDYQFVVHAAGGMQLVNDTGLTFAGDGQLTFGGTDRVLLQFPEGSGNLGVDGNEVYFTTAERFAWRDGTPGPDLMQLDNSSLTVNGTFVSSSDRSLKENVQPVSPQDILAQVAALPIARWNYKGNASTTHVGPMAQDFHAAFGVGPDDRHIAMVDADGVALAAIQGLNEKLEAQSQKLAAENEALQARNEQLEARLERLEKILGPPPK